VIVGAIPARYASTRFPGKLLADLHGRSVLERTWRRASRSASLDRLVIAAGDEVIASAARGFGAEVIELFQDFNSGSDRIAEAVRRLEDDAGRCDIVVNVQGDEPMLDPETVDKTVARLKDDPSAGAATPVTPIRSADEFNDPSAVKAVLDEAGRALYFSRAAVPRGWDGADRTAFRHIGLYAYRRNVLMDFAQQPPCRMELYERLEQLRLLYYGVKVAAVVVEDAGMGVDTEEGLERVRRLLESRP